MRTPLDEIDVRSEELRKHLDTLYEIAKRAGVVGHWKEDKPDHPDYGLLLGASHDASSCILGIRIALRELRKK